MVHAHQFENTTERRSSSYSYKVYTWSRTLAHTLRINVSSGVIFTGFRVHSSVTSLNIDRYGMVMIYLTYK